MGNLKRSSNLLDLYTDQEKEIFRKALLVCGIELHPDILSRTLDVFLLVQYKDDDLTIKDLADLQEITWKHRKK